MLARVELSKRFEHAAAQEPPRYVQFVQISCPRLIGPGILPITTPRFVPASTCTRRVSVYRPLTWFRYTRSVMSRGSAYQTEIKLLRCTLGHHCFRTPRSDSQSESRAAIDAPALHNMHSRKCKPVHHGSLHSSVSERRDEFIASTAPYR